jgi:hypothetical protein
MGLVENETAKSETPRERLIDTEREGLAEMNREINVLARRGELGLERLEENEAVNSETPRERLAGTRWEGLAEMEEEETGSGKLADPVFQ